MRLRSPQIPIYLHASFKDAFFFNLMIGLGESYLVAFALALGMGQTQAGLVAVAPMLFGATLQLFSAMSTRYLRSRQKFITICAATQGISLILMGQLARWNLHGNVLVAVVFGLASLYWSAALAAGPTWNAWISRIVPAEHRIQFFARRTRVAQFAVLIGLITTGIILESSKGTPDYLRIFAWLFFIAGCCRLVSAFYIGIQDDNKTMAANPLPKIRGGIIERTKALLAKKQTLKIVGYLFLINTGVYISAPYFSPYMLKQLDLNFHQYMLLTATSFVSRVLANDFFIFLARARGVKSLLILGAIGVAPLPFCWTQIESFYALIILQAIGGMMWGAHELGMTLYLLERNSEQDRAEILTLANFFNSIGMFTGGMIGASLLTAKILKPEHYHLVFIASSAARILPIIMLAWIEEVHTKIRHIYIRILSVRPSGALIKSFTFEHDEDED